eukprot:768817-Hanusia_phi.AAC.4
MPPGPQDLIRSKVYPILNPVVLVFMGGLPLFEVIWSDSIDSSVPRWLDEGVWVGDHRQRQSTIPHDVG